MNDGGPAFPVSWNVPNAPEPGMTLRDYFAAAAMQGYCSSEKWRVDANAERTARAAYTMADAMIAEKEKYK